MKKIFVLIQSYILILTLVFTPVLALSSCVMRTSMSVSVVDSVISEGDVTGSADEGDITGSADEGDITVSAVNDGKISDQNKKINRALKITALGDSITRGYGLQNPGQESYPFIVAEQLKKYYRDVNVSNYAVNGMTSAGLIELLNSKNTKELRDAEVIFLCIGANNILRHGMELLNIGDMNIMELFILYKDYLLGNNQDQSVPKTLDDYFKKVISHIESSEYKQKIEESARELREDIPVIIDLIRRVNRDAKIYYCNIYSPYNRLNLSLPYVDTMLPLGDISDKYVEILNKEIENSAAKSEYNIIDINKAFSESGQNNVNAGINEFKLDYDPHPNINGHNLIADEIMKKLVEDMDL